MELIMVDEVFNDNLKDIVMDVYNDIDFTYSERADAMVKYLKAYGLEEVGCGTNRIVFKHKDYNDVIFKIALDSRGLKDNELEMQLSPMLSNFVTPSYDTNSYILSARCADKIFCKQDMIDNKDEVKFILKQLSQFFILNDVGYKSFYNWCYLDGKIAICDYAYLRPITDTMDFTCHYKINGIECNGRLRYNKNFTKFKCSECGGFYSLTEIKDPLSELIENDGVNFSNSFKKDFVIDRVNYYSE